MIDRIAKIIGFFNLKTRVLNTVQNLFVFRLYDIVTQKCGSGAADTVRGFRATQYPLVVVIMKNRSSLEVSAVIQGTLRTQFDAPNYLCF